MDDGERPAEPKGERTPRQPRHWFTYVAIFLLITIPAVYLVISAVQSRNSGEDKQENAAMHGLADGWPSKVQRRIYDVPVPAYSADVAYYETNSWGNSSLYVQFVTSDAGLTTFLHRIGTNRALLRDGSVTIDAKESGKVGWAFDAGQKWSGMVVHQKQPEPKLEITVGFGNPRHPKVYVVSTVTP